MWDCNVLSGNVIAIDINVIIFYLVLTPANVKQANNEREIKGNKRHTLFFDDRLRVSEKKLSMIIVRTKANEMTGKQNYLMRRSIICTYQI
jgi:hypothetical protein